MHRLPWSRLRTQVEALFADSVRIRVRLHSTQYHKMHDQGGREWITVDGVEIVNMPHNFFIFYATNWPAGQEDVPPERVDDIEGSEEEREARQRQQAQSLFGDGNLSDAMFAYLHLSIDEILSSDVLLIRALGMLDRRTGKRRLAKLEINNAHPLVKLLHAVRCDAEGMTAAATPRPGLAKKELDFASMLRKEHKQQKQRARPRAMTKLARDKLIRIPRSLVTRIYRRQLAENELETDLAREVHAAFQQASNRKALLDALLLVDRKSKLLKSAPYARGVMALITAPADSLRPLHEWTPTSHNMQRQFSQLARHLWAVYDVPLFMDHAWLQANPVHQRWFRHVGLGKNIRTADDLPIPLTKKMAHYFLQAPQHYSIEGALRWGQVHALGGNQRLADALLGTRLVREFRDDPFWLTVLRFFIYNPMLDTAQINPIIDYIWNQRYEPRLEFLARGVPHELPPEQPNFSMRGRTVESLLRAIKAWHRRLGTEEQSGQLQWQKSPFQDFTFVEGATRAQNLKTWRIVELLSRQELIAEGRKMHHCVASFGYSCYQRKRSIWAMEVDAAQGTTPLLTIEVDQEKHEICQARGNCNRLPTEKEIDVVQRWAAREGLRLANYL